MRQFHKKLETASIYKLTWKKLSPQTRLGSLPSADTG